MALPAPLGVASEDDGQERLFALLGVSGSAAAEIDRLAAAAAENPDEVADVLRVILAASAGEGDLVGPAIMNDTLDHVGERQIAISGDMYALGVLLISCYIAYKGQGRASTKKTTTIETMPDGRVKTVISEEVIYLSPFSPLVTLIKTLAKSGKGDGTGAIADDTNVG